LIIALRSILAFILIIAPGARGMANAGSATETVDARQASLEYNASVVNTLLAKGDPRSLAFAATMLPLLGDAQSTDGKARSDLLAEAVQQGPDDVLVQWLGALYMTPDARTSPAARALLRLEPENGAAWMFPLQAALAANDADGVTGALRHIGAATRFDVHFADFSLAWATFYREHPAPVPQGRPTGFHSDEQPLVAGIASAAAMAMPAFQYLVRACKVNEVPLTTDRREACIAAGRLMFSQSAEQISRGLGVALLRNADAPGHEQARRTVDYLGQMYTQVSESLDSDPAMYQQFESDWQETRSETAVIERTLTRAGVPLVPPADWEPPKG
jgi:hypothetical protein